MITVTNLRKIFTEQGVKGASKWKREDFESAIIAAEFAAHEANDLRTEEIRIETELSNAEVKTAPELNEAKRPARIGRSRAGMVIIAKGTEVHKSQTFKTAAEAAGWTVTITGEHIDEDGNGRYYADAYRGEDAIQLAWEGRAYDYPASSALVNGKSRKVRNLKEALRLLVA